MIPVVADEIGVHEPQRGGFVSGHLTSFLCCLCWLLLSLFFRRTQDLVSGRALEPWLTRRTRRTRRRTQTSAISASPRARPHEGEVLKTMPAPED